jgi:hypothetical protein
VLDTLAYRAVLRSAARSTLVGAPRSRVHADRGRFSEADVHDLLGTVWRFEHGMPARPVRGDHLRTRVTLRLSAFAAAFLDALLLREVEREYAIELVADLFWKVIRAWGATRFGRAPPAFPPCAAAGPMRGVGQDGTVEITTCPVAELLHERDADDLCKRVWCDAAYAIGERAGATLDRERTIAEGAPMCRMTWRPRG